MADLAQREAAKAAALNDNLASVHLALAMVDRDTGDIDHAVEEFQRALRLDPADDETLNLLALTYDDAGRALQAESLLKDAVKRNPANWVNYNFLGAFYYRHAQYAQAEPLLRAASQLAPDSPSPLSNLGGFCWRKADTRKQRRFSPVHRPSEPARLAIPTWA